jgi:16S rRNA (uracil1498-N3)-methyltransferase
MNLILISADEVKDGVATLHDRRARHLHKVLRVHPGDSLRIGLINGLIGRGLVREISRERAVLEIRAADRPPSPSRLELILALPRPIMLNRVLSQVASMGIKMIHLINANRVEKSFFSASALQPYALAERLRLGLEQAVDTIMPQVTVHPRFRPFVEDRLPALLGDGATGLIAHPGDGARLAERLTQHTPIGPVLLAIGPEGGWVDFELAMFESQGFRQFTLGPRILRVDTAVPALIAQAELLLANIPAPETPFRA